MQISQAELLRRLGSSKNLGNSLPGSLTESIPPAPEPQPEPEQTKKISNGLRIVVGSLAKQGEKPAEIAREFGISVGQVTSAKHSENPKISGPINKSIERVQELAIEKTMMALGLLESTKMENSSARDISYIAASLSKIVANTRPAEKAEDTKIQLVVYAPQQKAVNDYRILDV
jgi:hypothetical protein